MTEKLEVHLVESALRGDLDSYGKLFDRNYAALTAIAYSILMDHHLAEDAAQEAFAKALTNLHRLKNPEKFAPWLNRICRNVAKDLARLHSRLISFDDPAQLSDKQNTSSNNRVVRQAIKSLPASSRELIVLRYYHQKSYEQMSAVLGLSKAAVKGRLNRAKKKLAKALRQKNALEVWL